MMADIHAGSSQRHMRANEVITSVRYPVAIAVCDGPTSAPMVAHCPPGSPSAPTAPPFLAKLRAEQPPGGPI